MLVINNGREKPTRNRSYSGRVSEKENIFIFQFKIAMYYLWLIITKWFRKFIVHTPERGKSRQNKEFTFIISFFS